MRIIIGIVTATLWIACDAAPSPGSKPAVPESGVEEREMTRAHGRFEVQLTPQSPVGGIGGLSISKQFTGALEGTSTGAMLAHRTTTDGSAGYVAIEMVTGTLDGRAGSFVLQHSSVMERGTPTQSISVIPDSGTGDLEGLSGQMIITITDGEHFYDFDYVISPEVSNPSAGESDPSASGNS